MTYVKSFRDLEVYKLSREVTREIYVMTKGFPVDERYSLTDQIRRSSRSVGAQIADSEQLETQHWIEISEECNYINTEKAKNTLQKCESIGKMIQAMIDKSSIFCNNKTPAKNEQ